MGHCLFVTISLSGGPCGRRSAGGRQTVIEVQLHHDARLARLQHRVGRHGHVQPPLQVNLHSMQMTTQTSALQLTTTMH